MAEDRTNDHTNITENNKKDNQPGIVNKVNCVKNVSLISMWM